MAQQGSGLPSPLASSSVATKPEVVEIARKPVEDLTVDDLEAEVIEVDSRRKIIKPKRNTYDYFKSLSEADLHRSEHKDFESYTTR